MNGSPKRFDVGEIWSLSLVSKMTVGECPKCESGNVHHCGKIEYIPTDKRAKLEQDIMRVGYNCPVAMKLDDPTIGHCDDCNNLWCLECLSEINEDSGCCEHYFICDECSQEQGYLTLGAFIEKICPECDYHDDGCTLDDPANECEKSTELTCPYDGFIMLCPTIQEWKKGSPS